MAGRLNVVTPPSSLSRTLLRSLPGLVLGGWLMTQPAGAADAAPALSPEQIYQQLLPSVATLDVETRKGDHIVGTGFLALAPDRLVTAWHLVADARRVTARFADDETVEIAGYLDRDGRRDVAVLPLPSGARPRCRIAPPDPPIGSRSYVLGAPKGFDFSISDGLLSQAPVIDGFRQYQITCPISPGNSGGPVVNDRGEVLGLVAWSQKDAQNLNFATPGEDLARLNVASTLIAWGSPEHRAAARVSRQRKDGETDGWVDRSHAQGLAELRQRFERAAGKPVTVIVRSGGQEETYRVVVPEGFVR